MKQVVLESGRIAVVEVPPPQPRAGEVLVRTSHSLISTGTELATTGGGQGLVRQAIANPDLMRKVRDKVSTVGLRQTIDLVKARRQSAMALGYSAAGVVVSVGDGTEGIRVGDRVACAGAGQANHAEINAVPRNLVCIMPPNVDFESAACATVGGIALQGIRRAAPTLGEQFVVVGLGLIGQMTAQVLRAHGVRVFGVDLRASRVALAKSLGMEGGLVAGEGDLARMILDWTGGAGADAVILCASGGDASLLNSSLALCRRKGRLIIVGDVPIRIHRERVYRKEIDVLISTSYGPGRYDSEYEEKGLDYPIGYVRWTENRNICEVLRLISTGSLQVRPLISRSWPAIEAPDAYESLRGGEAIGALLDFELPATPIARPGAGTVAVMPVRSGQVRLGAIGIGAFFKGVHHPMLKRHGGFALKTLIGRTGLSLKEYADHHGVPVVATDAAAVFDDPEIDAVLIATRHDLHAPLVLRALDAGKHVFVEKPLALTVSDCEAIVAKANATRRIVMVGFNRRFAPTALESRATFEPVRGPKTLLYRVNAGPLPEGHWLLDPRQGGGRLVGEGVHFFDFACWFVGAQPVTVRAAATRPNGLTDPDNVAATVAFEDGSVAVIQYLSTGAAGLGKERVEILGGGRTAVIDDFASISIWDPRPRTVANKKGKVDKGHFQILSNFHDAITGRAPAGVTAIDGWRATWCARAALDSLVSGREEARG